jgi:hypothetical protein
MLLGGTPFEVVAHEFIRTDVNPVLRWHTLPPIVDARELYSTLVDLLFCGCRGNILSNETVSRRDIVRSKPLKVSGCPKADRFGSWTLSSFLNRRRHELSDHSGAV